MGNITQKALIELLQYIQSIRVDSNGQDNKEELLKEVHTDNISHSISVRGSGTLG
jgi:hypothetical protein